jgi:ADP-ribosylglycohydrolase
MRRALGALYGLAIGDAMGMPTQLLPRDLVRRLFPTVDDFFPGPPENRVSRGQPAGRVTDDTEQALILADLLVEGRGRVDPTAFAHRLLAWAQDAEANGTDQLGPSTRRALEAVQRGVSTDDSGRRGTTDGAAMRITPFGVASVFQSPRQMAQEVADVVRVTHNTGVAIGGAAAVATLVSVAIEGRSFTDAVEAAVETAEYGQTLGHYVPSASVATRIVWALETVRGKPWSEAANLLERLIGLGVETVEAVPAAFAILSLSPEDPWTVACRAASLGGDSDTIGAIATAMAGALAGVEVIPPYARDAVERANHLNLVQRAMALWALRAHRLGTGSSDHGKRR